MGIKFYCPNGHKLNVKSFLSGKKAICPQCGAKVMVPAQSQIAAAGADADDQITPENGSDLSPAAADQVHAASAGAIAANFASKAPAAATAAGQPNQARTAAVPNAAMPAAGAPAGSVNPAAFAQPAAPANPGFGGWGAGGVAPGGFGAREPVAAPQVPAAAAPMAGYGAMGMRDAIDEAPAAVWYVRPASGGQFGPAPGETMRAWIDEGRVAATALVWRTGWPEWRSAAATFPKLAATVAAPWTPAPGYGAAPAAPAMPMQGGPWGAAAAAPVAPLGMAPAGMVMAPVQSVGVASPTGYPVGQVIGGHAVGNLAVPAETFATTDQTEESGTRIRKRRRQQADMTMIVSVILVVLTVVLVIVLAVVLSRQNEPEAGAPRPKPAEAAKEKPAAKEPTKKSQAAKKPAGKKAKPAAMDEDADDSDE